MVGRLVLRTVGCAFSAAAALALLGLALRRRPAQAAGHDPLRRDDG